jgi:hypothetical protein
VTDDEADDRKNKQRRKGKSRAENEGDAMMK